jgi:site-specific DNA recombinase
MKNCYIYTRTATATLFEILTQEIHSCSLQINKCKDYAKKNNLRIIREFKDIAFDGAKDERESLTYIHQNFERDNVNIILISEITRISRDYLTYFSITNKLRKLGFKVICVETGLNILKTQNDLFSSSANSLHRYITHTLK